MTDHPGPRLASSTPYWRSIVLKLPSLCARIVGYSDKMPRTDFALPAGVNILGCARCRPTMKKPGRKHRGGVLGAATTVSNETVCARSPRSRPDLSVPPPQVAEVYSKGVHPLLALIDFARWPCQLPEGCYYRRLTLSQRAEGCPSIWTAAIVELSFPVHSHPRYSL